MNPGGRTRLGLDNPLVPHSTKDFWAVGPNISRLLVFLCVAPFRFHKVEVVFPWDCRYSRLVTGGASWVYPEQVWLPCGHQPRTCRRCRRTGRTVCHLSVILAYSHSVKFFHDLWIYVLDVCLVVHRIWPSLYKDNMHA